MSSCLTMIASLLLASTALAQSPATPGLFGSALRVDGDEGYMWMTPVAAGRSEGTIEMWVNYEGFVSEPVFWVGGRGRPGTGSTGHHAFFGVPVIAGSTTIEFGMYIGITCCWWLADSGVGTDVGTWRHVAATWGPDGFEVYVGGQLLGTYPRTDAMLNYQVDLIGSRSGNGGMTGLIDEVRFWAVQRDEAEIQSTMERPLTPDEYGSADVLAYYPLDAFEDLGVNGDGADDLRDLSPNAHHADAEGEVSLEGGAVPVGNISWGAVKATFRPE